MQNSQVPMSAKAGQKLEGGFKQGQMPNFTPEQAQLFAQQFSHVGPESQTGRLAAGDQTMFDEMEAPAKRQFSAQQGQIASRFSGYGMGGRKGSGFQHEMNAASSDFAQDLASKRMDMQRQAIKDLMGMSNTILNQKPYENYMTKKQPKQPWWKKALNIAAPIVGGVFGGPAGASAGAMFGNAMNSDEGFNGADFSQLSGMSNKWG